MTIIDKGVLKTFMLSLYGAKKTSRDRVDFGSAILPRIAVSGITISGK